VNKHSLLIRRLSALSVLLLLLTATIRPVPDYKKILQPIAFDQRPSYKDPQLALKGFGRVMLDPGESRTLHFRLGPDQLALWNRDMKKVVEPGEFSIMVGSSSADIRLNDSLRVIPHPSSVLHGQN
jgi:beta-glucosidase